MKQVYDYGSNRIVFKDKKGILYDLELNGKITIIDGMSASGKTLLINSLKAVSEIGAEVSGYEISNIYVYSGYEKDAVNIQDDNILYIIDRADRVLDKEDCEKINRCNFSRFLLFTRLSLDLDVSPSHFGEFIEKDKRISIKYAFDKGSWV